MRVLFFIFLVFTFSAGAQTPALKNSFDEAVETARRGEFENASEKFRRVLFVAETEKSSDEFLVLVHFNLGVCFYHLKETKRAVGEFTEAIKLSRREYKPAFYALGMAESDLKNFDAAENAFRNALKLDKTDGEAWFDLGLVYLEKRDFEKAENAFENSIKFKSVAAADAFNNLGVIFALRHEFDLAEQRFETALKISEGKSETAKNNLRFCKFYRQKNQTRDLIAKLEFKSRGRSPRVSKGAE
jgi:Flp pilus assembly protein TadD